MVHCYNNIPHYTGAGEYNTGYVPTKAGAAADKKAGVVALVSNFV